MSDETILRECPFCGGEAELVCNDIGVFVGCFHENCPIGPQTSTYLDGYATEAEAIAAWNARAAHGTLTAEQAREAIEEAKAELLESCEYVGDMWQRKGDVLKAFGKMEQAIADELNAELGGGTCRISASSTDGLCSDNPRKWCELSCGHSFTLEGLGKPVACPVCGKAVER